ncbi:MAG: hypothetical protein GEU90_02985 [Gemmatimonas sp.]|nr:hypothetical protein [Gemmatimonas sp.]
MPKRARSLVVGLLAAGFIAGCDQGTEPNSALSPAGARALAVMIDNTTTGAVDSQAESEAQLSLSPSDGATMDVLSGTHSFELEVPCPLAGEAAVGGDLTFEAGEGSFQMDVSASANYLECEFTTNEDVEVALDGSLSFEAERRLDQDGVYGLNVHTGSLDFSTSEGESGTCEIDLTTELAAGNGSATRSISGSVCGHEVTANSEWS